MIGVVLLAAVQAQAEQASLYEKFSRAKETTVSVSLPTDASTDKKIDVQVLKTEIEKALEARKSVRLKPVADASQAQIVVDAEVNGFQYRDEDPVDMIMGAGPIAMDAIKKEHFVTTEVTFTVKDRAAGTVLWKDKLRGSVTDAAMSEAESPAKVSERISEIFVREAFGRKKK